MEYKITNGYNAAYILKQPTCQIPFGVRPFVSLLRAAVNSIFSPSKFKIRHIESIIAIKLFERFLETAGLEEITPDENLLEDFKSVCSHKLLNKKGKLYKKQQIDKAVDYVRYLINSYFYPRRLISRQIILRKAFLKYKRFLSLSEHTQNLIVLYENDGRYIQVTKKYFEGPDGNEHFRYQIRRKVERLSAYNRKCRIASTLTLLSSLGKEAIEHIEQPDLERLIEIYQAKDKKGITENYLAAFFSIVAAGASSFFSVAAS